MSATEASGENFSTRNEIFQEFASREIKTAKRYRLTLFTFFVYTFLVIVGVIFANPFSFFFDPSELSLSIVITNIGTFLFWFSVVIILVLSVILSFMFAIVAKHFAERASIISQIAEDI